MNYFKSEHYRLMRRKELFVTVSVSLGFVIAAVCALYFSLQADARFTYGTNRFLYINVLSSFQVILLVGLLIGRQLLGQSTLVVKQSVAFGITRNRIFFTKLVLTLAVFLLVCFVGILIVLLGGENLLTADRVARQQFLISVVNFIPWAVSGFVLGYTLMILIRNEIVGVCVTMVLFSGIFSNITSVVEQALFKRTVLSPLLPGALIEQSNTNFLLNKATVTAENWLVGCVIILVSVSIGAALYNKKNF